MKLRKTPVGDDDDDDDEIAVTARVLLLIKFDLNTEVGCGHW